jgi:hypothetical protein
VLGNPQAQGAAPAFCRGLQRLAPGAPVLLYSDSVDASFARQHQMAWLSPAQSGEAELQECVAGLLAAARVEPRKDSR